jgi:SAM-dependent methyltransferase
MSHHADFFCHKIDLYWGWKAKRNPLWLERGIFSLYPMKPGADVLELCCGDGFNTCMFYSGRAGSIVAVDFDRQAITYAKKNFPAPNIDFQCADIRLPLPRKDYGNVVWDASMEYFSPAEIGGILVQVQALLNSKQGILSGYCHTEQPNEAIQHVKFAPRSKDDLRKLLSAHFSNVRVFETIYPERNNLYFWASEGELPSLT